MHTIEPPTGAHLFGTDALGRDQLSRVIYGSRIAVIIGLVSILLDADHRHRARRGGRVLRPCWDTV